MSYFYDTQASIPKNVTLVNRRRSTCSMRRARRVRRPPPRPRRAAGRCQGQTKWYPDQLSAKGMQVLPPSKALKSGLQRIGEQLTDEWLLKAGPDGRSVIAAYRSSM